MGYNQKDEVIAIVGLSTLTYAVSSVVQLALSMMLKSRLFVYMINPLTLILSALFVTIAYPSHSKFAKRKMIIPIVISIASYELNFYGVHAIYTLGFAGIILIIWGLKNMYEVKSP